MSETRESSKVQVYTSAHIFTGYLGVLPRQRLLDKLNGVLTGALRTNEDFLHLNEAEMYPPDGGKAALQSVCINKASILFARESEGSQIRRPGGEAGRRPYPFVNKSPVAVRLLLPTYTLTGEMHCAEGETLSDVLNSGRRFIPLTNVEIFPPTGSSESVVSFIGVNREQIVCLGRVGGYSERSAKC